MRARLITRRISLFPANNVRLKSTIVDLQDAFRDPKSPFHIPPGGKGPASPDDVPESFQANTESEAMQLEDAREMLVKEGLDPLSFWEQRIVWGDQDSFQHVNNTNYVRFFESSRIKWMVSLGEELGGRQKAEEMLRAKGVSLILRSIEVQFRRPVTYPDTLLIGYRPIISDKRIHSSTLPVAGKAYSLSQKTFVAHSNEVLVWYDYDKLKKCDPGHRVRDIINSRVQKLLASK